MNSSHLSSEMREFIKKLGLCTSKAQQDQLIKTQLKFFKDQAWNPKQQQSIKAIINKYILSPSSDQIAFQNLIRVLYGHILGYDIEGACIFAINATQSKSYRLKRLAYLCSSIFLIDIPQLKVLLISSLHKDLSNKNLHQLVMALTTINSALSVELLPLCLHQVRNLLSHPTDLVRKKAFIIICKAYRLNRQLVDDFAALMKQALYDGQMSVFTIGLQMLQILLKQSYKVTEELSRIWQIVQKMLIYGQFQKYKYHKFPNPWVQLNILRIIALLGQQNCQQQDLLFEILLLISRKAEKFSLNNIEYAVFLECCKTLKFLPCNNYIQQSLSDQVSKLFNRNNNNLLSYGVRCIGYLSQKNVQFLNKHQLILVDCLQNQDYSIKKIAVQLMVKHCTTQNVAVVNNLILNLIKASPDQFSKGKLLCMSMSILQRLSESAEWYTVQMNKSLLACKQLISQSNCYQYSDILKQNMEMKDQKFSKFIFLQMANLYTRLSQNDILIIVVVATVLKAITLFPYAFEHDADMLTQIAHGCYKNSLARPLSIQLISSLKYIVQQIQVPQCANLQLLDLIESQEFSLKFAVEPCEDLQFLKVQGKRSARTRIKQVIHTLKLKDHQQKRTNQTRELVEVDQQNKGKEIFIKNPSCKWTAQGYSLYTQQQQKKKVENPNQKVRFKGPVSKTEKATTDQENRRKLRKARQIFGKK